MNNSVFRSEVEKDEAEGLVGLELGTGEEAMALTCDGGRLPRLELSGGLCT